MGFATSVTQAIFFIAAVIVALSLVGVMSFTVNSVSNSIREKGAILSDRTKTDLTIANAECFTSGQKALYVINTGKSSLNANLTYVLVDSQYYAVSAIRILQAGTWSYYSDSDSWDPTELVNFTMASNFPAGTHTISVVSDNGVMENLEYYDSGC